MARTRTVAQMLARAAVLSGTVDSTHVNATERLDLLNQAITSLWDRLTTVSPTRYMTPTTITAVAGQREYTLPTNFMALVGVSYIQGNDVVPLAPFSYHERGTGLHATQRGPYPGQFVRFDVLYQGATGTATRLVFDDDPTGTYRADYVTVAPTLVLTTDTFDGINGWEDEAVYTVAIDLALAEQSDTSELRAEREDIRQRIAKLAPRRVIGQPKQVASVWSRYGDRYRRD
jgi:2-hydroxychromene-2-carboxylate isomerase